MQLVTCGECRRHVAIGERACPFCAAPIEGGSAKRGAPLLGRVGRAAVFASASATAACWTTSSPPATTTTTTSGGGGGGSARDSRDSDDGPPRPHVDIPAPLAGMASIGGICLDSATGKPLAGVRVEIIAGVGAGRKGATSDASGRYVVNDMPPGEWNVRFWAAGDPQRMAPPSQFVTLKAGDVKRIDGNVDNRDWSNIPMPYGAPPSRRRVV